MDIDLWALFTRQAAGVVATSQFRGSFSQWGIQLDQRLIWFHSRRQVVQFLSDLILPLCSQGHPHPSSEILDRHSDQVLVWKAERIFLHEFAQLTNQLLSRLGHSLTWIGTFRDLCLSGEDVPCLMRLKFREQNRLEGGFKPIRPKQMIAFKKDLEKGLLYASSQGLGTWFS